MKTLLSLCAAILALWFVAVFVLPQTSFWMRLHQEIETALSRQLGGELSILGELHINLLPPEIIAEKVVLKKQQKTQMTIEKLSATLNLSVLFSNHVRLTVLSLERPVLLLAGYGFEQIFLKSKPLLPFLNFSFITFKQGRLTYQDHKTKKSFKLTQVSGFISADQSTGPVESKIRFVRGDKNYEGRFFIARPLAHEPVQLDFSLNHQDHQLKFIGFLKPNNRLDGEMMLSNSSFGIDMQTTARIIWQGYRITSDDITIRAENILLHAQGWLDLSQPSLRWNLNLHDGHVLWQGARFEQIKAVLSAKQNKITGRDFSAITPQSGSVQGAWVLQDQKLKGNWTLRTQSLDWLAKALGWRLTPSQLNNLTSADLSVSLQARGKQLERLKLQGKIAKTSIQLQGNFAKQDFKLFAKLKNPDSRQLASQIGWAPVFTGRGASTAKIQLKGNLKDNNQLIALMRLGDLHYLLRGRLAQKNAQWQSFEGSLKAKGASAQNFIKHLGFANTAQIKKGFKLAAQLKAQPDNFALSKIRFYNQKNHIKGRLSLLFRSPDWRIHAHLISNHFPITLFKPKVKHQWSTRSVLPQGIKNISGRIRLHAGHLNLVGLDFRKVKLELHLPENKSEIRVKNFQAQLHGGKVLAAADLSLENQKPCFNIVLALNRVRLKPLTYDLFGESFLKGRMTLETRLSAEGKNMAEFVKSLDGQGRVSTQQGAFLGFDAALVNQSLPQLEAFSFLAVVINYAFSHGETNFGKLAGNFHIQKGRLSTKVLRLNNPDLEAQFSLRANLSRKQMHAHFSFKWPIRPDYPPMRWTLTGAWNKPHQSFDSLALEKAFAQDIISGGIQSIENAPNIQELPLPLQDLLRTTSPEPKAEEMFLEGLDLAS